jgi:hypothetical protein
LPISNKRLLIHLWLILFPLTCWVSPLFALHIDLSSEEAEWTLPINWNQDHYLELHHAQPSTLYILHTEGVEWVSMFEMPFVTFGKNSLLIEHQTQLAEHDTLILNCLPVHPDHLPSVLHLSKRAIQTSQYPNLGNEKWGQFIDQARSWKKPSAAAQQLAETLSQAEPKHIFVVGCESGKDPLFLASKGHNVSILDGTPHAVAITCLRLAEHNALPQLKNALVCNLEAIPNDLGTFDVVSGSAVFPFIAPENFVETMTQHIFSHIVPSGYFAGHFFGPEHAWASNPNMTFIQVEKLQDLFQNNGFEIVWLNESKTIHTTVFHGEIPWHEIQLIAKRN